jgi:hypothetical protein
MNEAPIALFLFLAVGAVALFSFAALASWTKARKEERIALYRSELLKKVAEQPGEGARQVLVILREDAAQKELAKRRGLLLGGLITAVVGIGLMTMLSGIRDSEVQIWAVGFIPLLIGVVMFLFGWFAIRPAQSAPDSALPEPEPR